MSLDRQAGCSSIILALEMGSLMIALVPRNWVCGSSVTDQPAEVMFFKAMR